MASGVALCLHRAGLGRILLLEAPEPLAVRRTVSFCEAVYTGTWQVEELVARRASTVEEMEAAWRGGKVAVAVDPEWRFIRVLRPGLVVDAILAKRNLGTNMGEAPLVIGLGPGFTAGMDAHLAVETRRGHNLGRIYSHGSAEPNTGVPGPIEGYTVERVLRAPCSGVVLAERGLGDSVEPGEVVCVVDGREVRTVIGGVLRGLIRPGLRVEKGVKIGDVDPRGKLEYCWSISEKARTLGGAVLGAVCASLSAPGRARQRELNALPAKARVRLTPSRTLPRRHRAALYPAHERRADRASR